MNQLTQCMAAEQSRLSLSSKLQLHNALLGCLLLYGAETWTLIKSNEQKLGAFQIRRPRGQWDPCTQYWLMMWAYVLNYHLHALYMAHDACSPSSDWLGTSGDGSQQRNAANEPM